MTGLNLLIWRSHGQTAMNSWMTTSYGKWENLMWDNLWWSNLHS